MSSLFSINFDDIDAYAHSKNTEKEHFSNHCNKTLEYYKKICGQFEIQSIYDNLLDDIDNSFDKENLKNLLEKFILLHDIGKLTDKFQKKLDGSNISETHSDKSFFILVHELLLQKKQNTITSKEFFLLFILSYAVLKHHGNLSNILENISSLSFNRDKMKINEIEKYSGCKFDEKILNLMENETFWQKWNYKESNELFRQLSENSLSLFILSKLFYSLLVSSDYYATLHFMKDHNFELDTIDESFISNSYNKFHYCEEIPDNFNVKTNKEADNLLSIDLSEITDDLNKLRSKLNIEAEERIKNLLGQDTDNNVFFLNIPTGGGKTNISLRLALQIMSHNKDIKKLFYVFPFINIIEQSYDSLSKFIDADNMTRLDSRYIDPNISDDYDKNDLYANYIDNLFFNKKALFTSHVKFFDLFFRNDKNTNYNFFQLANSVVIIDEIQAYNDKVWTEISYLLNDISKLMNTHFIVMSATLPQIEKLSGSNFNHIFDENFSQKLFNHKLFQRTEIKPVKTTKNNIMKELKKQKEQNKILVVFNKVKDSLEYFEKLNKENAFNDHEKYLLNSTILDDRRKEILENCRNPESKVILVSTQSVEAGVDVDFDVGFRAYAPWDSIVQVAGRVNRNNKKELSTVYVFKDDDYKKVYRNDVKASITEDKHEIFFKNDQINELELLPTFYETIIDDIEKNNKNPFVKNSEGNVADMKNLFFSVIDKEIYLIEGTTISLYIPINEDAENLWKEYINLINTENSFENILKIKEERKKLQKYSINIFDTYTSNGKLSTILNEELKYGYYYCKGWKKYYSVNTGLDSVKFQKEVLGREAMFI